MIASTPLTYTFPRKDLLIMVLGNATMSQAASPTATIGPAGTASVGGQADLISRDLHEENPGCSTNFLITF